MRNYTWLIPVSCVFVAVLLISNITSTKIVALGPLTFDAWTLFFPLAYIFGDILTEVYGYKISRKVIWIWLFCSLLLAWSVMLVWYLPSAADWPFQQDYMNVLGLTWRIVLASVVAYIVGEFSNAYIVAKMKILSQGKQMRKRFLASTLVWQWLDTLVFVLIAFGWVFWRGLVWTIILSNYVFKVLVEVIFMPLTYKIVAFLKKEEGEDVYDTPEDLQPLAW